MEFHDKKPIYLQLADYFFEKILKGELKPGDKIMSVRELAIEAEVTPNTAMRAFSYLQNLGIIFNKRGIGYFVAEDAFDKTMKIKKTEFIEKDLPLFFKTITTLKISFDELKKLYSEYEQSKTSIQ
jgi:GntR family transcriptional regulator